MDPRKNINYRNTSGVDKGEEKKLPPPRNPGKFAKNGEQPTPQPEMKIDSKRKFIVSLNFPRFLLKFS